MMPTSQASDPAFAVDSFAAVRLSSGDVGELQVLHERCSGYFEIVEGAPTRPTSAAEDLVDLPPGKAPDDKFYFGIRAADGTLVGALDIVRDYPAPGTWILGLLMLDPAVRGGGLGARVYEAARAWVRAQGGHEISIAVLEQNTAAERFWRRRGFRETARVPYAAATGFTSTAIIMTHPTAPDHEG
jgi:GNAT superfamily N-acetyltransferase